MNDVSRWVQEVHRSRDKFERLLDIAEGFLSRRKLECAASVAQIAAHFATYSHPGIFSSSRLDRLLTTIGTAIGGSSMSKPSGRPHRIERVLHVLTSAKDVGGDTRFVWRWMQRDPNRSHSVAMTKQLNFPIPSDLVEYATGTGGNVYVLDRESSSPIEQANQLRAIASDFDLVALHIYPEDIVPTLAFSADVGRPVVAWVALADHQFWTGCGIADCIVFLRNSGAQLGVARRSIAGIATSFLPIPLEMPNRTMSRNDAKQRLGLDEDTVLVLSIARPMKYEPIEGPGFVDVLKPLLETHEHLVIFVVGPSTGGPWEAACRETNGRIRAQGQRSDTATFYEAADIYVDSFPFSSNTSLLEAGAYGLPLVTYAPNSAESAVLGAGAPGFDGTLLRARSHEELRDTISRLISDRAYREALGERTRAELTSVHCGPGWFECLDNTYRCATQAQRLGAPAHDSSIEVTGELDVLLHRFYSSGITLGWIIGWNIRDRPYFQRVQMLRKLAAVDRSFSFSMFLPAGWGTRLGRWLRGWRGWPVVGSLGSSGPAQ